MANIKQSDREAKYPYEVKITNGNILRFVSSFIYDERFLKDEVIQWLDKNVQDYVTDDPWEISFLYFSNQEDALTFKLTWL